MLKEVKTLKKEWGNDERRKFQKQPKNNFTVLTMCQECYAFHYENSWHFKRPDYVDEYDEEEIVVAFTQCTACTEQEDALYQVELEVMLH